MTRRRRSSGCRRQGDERGEALPAAILFVGVLFTILIGIHVVIVSTGRAAVQAAADSALAAAQTAGHGDHTQDCDGDPTTLETARQCAGILGARIAIAGAHSSIVEIRPPAIIVERERGTVAAFVFAGALSPVFGSVELTGQACGPLDDVSVAELTGTDSDIWQC